jgi:hypothetical protein
MQKPIPQLETVSAKDLLAQPIEKLGFTIDAILPHGLFILAGSSKIGKSWLALEMSNCVTSGDTFWNYPVKQGDVLYLALEDNNKRLQSRLSKVASAYDSDSKTDIHFVTKVKRLGCGLSEQITEFLDEHPRTNLIVVDTLQYIRNSGSYMGTYSGDYHDMDALRGIIAGRELAMLLITHNHKSDDADPINRVYGSAGLTGAVDGIFVLEKKKRNSDKAKLTIASRDAEDHQFELRFDRAACRWMLVGEVADDADDEDQLFDFLNLLLDDTPNWCGTATQLKASLDVIDPAFSISPITLSKLLKARQDYLRVHHGIECRFSRNKSARLIELSRDIIVVDYEIVENEPLSLAG